MKMKEVAPGPSKVGQIVKESYLGDYTEVQGGKVPMRIKGYMAGDLKLDAAILEIHFLDAIDEKEFERP